MSPTPRRSPAGKILHFKEWMEQTYPEKTPAVKMLRMVGALDLMYLMYRMQNMGKAPEKKTPPIRTKKPERTEPVVPVAPLAIQEKKVEPVTVPEEIVMEFEKPTVVKPDPKPVVAARSVPAPLPKPEPEPLDLHTTPEPEPVKVVPVAKVVVPKKPAVQEKLIWIDDESLEDEDMLKTRKTIGVDGIRVQLEQRSTDDGNETLINIDDRTFRVRGALLPVSLSAMVQIAKVSYGEFYMFGSSGIGGLSGKAYIAPTEMQCIAHVLKDATEKHFEAEIIYSAQDKTVRSRKIDTTRVIFERVK